MHVVELTLVALVAAAITAGVLVVMDRRRRGDAEKAVHEEADALRRRGREAAEAERLHLVAQGRRRAEALQRELLGENQAAEGELEAEDARLAGREGAIDRRAAELEERSKEIDAQFETLRLRSEAAQALQTEAAALTVAGAQQLESTAHLTRPAALDEVRTFAVDAARVAAQKAARLREETAKANAEISARQTIDLVCQRYGTVVPTDRLNTTVTMPAQGRFRERLLADGGALMRLLTEKTQVEFQAQGDAAGEEGETFFLQASDAYVREIGRQAFERLLKEREPNEGAVTRCAAKAIADVERAVRNAGSKAAELLHIPKMHPEILLLVGKLVYRTSYTQNQWAHAIETAYLCGMLAEDLGVDPAAARRAALIHDIGKVLYAETDLAGSHAVSGAAFARAHGEPPEIVHAVAAHHNDEKPETALAHLVAAADALSGARPGARRATEEAYSMRVEDLERICQSFRGIESHFVIQGGRELRIVVDQTRLSDMDAARLSSDVAARIEGELTYPGQIKVTVIREMRAQAVARY